MPSRPPSPRPLRPGRRLAPGYTVVEHLARGEALDVYDAWDVERHCRCVVKLPRPDRAGDREVCARLRREGRLLGRLAHPHLVRAYATLPGPPPAVVLETLGGETLAHLLDERPRLPAAQVALLGSQLASALRYLHAQGYLHLDLKPSNVVVELGLARLLDLSIARRPGRTRRGVGTPDYMAPEQARGEPLGPAADVWGLGTVLFEAAAGRPAFAGGDGEDLAQLGSRAPRIRTLRRLPAALGRTIDASLEPRAADRPALDDVLEALESVT